MKQYTNYCTQEQTQKAYKLGAPLHVFECENKISKEAFIETGRIVELEDNKLGDIPTTQQMIGWLRKEKDIDICIGNTSLDYRFNVWHRYELIKEIFANRYDYNMGELAAIHAALDYLEKGE